MFQALVRFLSPKEDEFYRCLEQQAATANEGARALSALKQGSPEAVNEIVQEIEHRGDKLFHGLEDSLAKTFVTPIDREDIQKLSSELDDILDLTNGAARACVLYGLAKPTEPMIQLMNVLERTTELLATAMPHLRKHEYSALIEASRSMRKLEKDADVVFRKAVSSLFHDQNIDAKALLREKEILEDLENAIDCCARVATTLAVLAVKHG